MMYEKGLYACPRCGTTIDVGVRLSGLPECNKHSRHSVAMVFTPQVKKTKK